MEANKLYNLTTKMTPQNAQFWDWQFHMCCDYDN